MFGLKTSLRYAFSKKNGHRTSSVMIIIGIALGIMAVLVVGAVMDGLQSRQLDAVRNVSSFDAIIESSKLTPEELLNIPGVDEAYAFVETTVTVNSSQAMKVRGVDSTYFSSPRYNESVSVRLGTVDDHLVVMSYAAMSQAKVRGGEEFDLTFFSAGKVSKLRPYTVKCTISGTFSTSLSDFNSNYLYADRSWVKSIMGDSAEQIGIYVSGNWKNIAKAIQNKDLDARITTWQEYNSTLYSALMFEKVIMDVFLSSVILILLVSLKNSSKRLVKRKMREAAMMRAMGGTRKQIRDVFVIQALCITVIGEVLGALLTALVLGNLDWIFGVMGMGSLLVETHVQVVTAVLLAVCVPAISLLFTESGVRKMLEKDVMEVILHESN